mmetsp:Transcript_3330/g.8483  ORF Transcript_3330/g.8483 Transcript_3330/m.8483 type:complete len:539 (-) Transcript_3330:108-1724(-)
MIFIILFPAALIILVNVYILICRRNFQKLTTTPVRNPIDESHRSTKRVVIVGAGACGIAAAKTFIQYGYEDITVLERSHELGGVWNSGQYAGASIQQVYWLYAYPDFPWPKDLIASELSPGRDGVQEYLRRYSEAHGVLDRIRYGCEVKTAIRDEENDVWIVDTVQYGALTADILIMAVGNNDSSNPIVPELPNRELYRGRVLHSSRVGDGSDLIGAERIAVIGGSKSAFDIGQFEPDRTTLIMRTPHYWFPRWIMCSPFFDRITCFLFRGYLPDRRERSWIVRLLDEILIPPFAVGVNRPTKSRSVLDDIMVGGGIHVCVTLPEYRNARRWNLVQSSPVAYTEDGLELANGDTIKTDVIVWATGFEPSTFFRKVFPGVDLQDSLEDGLYLYKYIAHPSLPKCFFVGFKDPSLMTLCNSSLQSLWAVLCAAGVVKVPDAAEMRRNLDERKHDTRLRFPYSHRRAFYDYFLRPPNCDYTYGLDLVRDCGLEDRLCSFWCNPANIWTASLDFNAILALPIQNLQGSDSESKTEETPLALV